MWDTRSHLHAKMLGDGEDVLVAAPAHIHHEEIVARERRRQSLDESERMRRLERWDDALEPRRHLEGVERLLIGDGNIFHPAGISEPGMLRSDAGIIEARRDRMSFEDLSVVVLQKVSAIAVQNAGGTAGHRGGMTVRNVEPIAAGLDPIDRHRGLIEEGMEETHGIGAAADTG